MRCATCDTPVNDYDRFCSRCGQRTGGRVQVAPPPAPAYQPPAEPLPAAELRAALDTRHELGARMEPEVVDAFLGRVEHAIAARVDARVEQRLGGLPGLRRDANALPLAICSLIFGIPLSGIGGGIAHLPGLLVVWSGIGVVNLAYNLAGRRHH